MWKLARALEDSFRGLITTPTRTANRWFSRDPRERKLVGDEKDVFPPSTQVRLFRLPTGAVAEAPTYAAGTLENVVVREGAIDFGVGVRVHTLRAGDAIVFEAHVPHWYRNSGSRAALVSVMITHAGDRAREGAGPSERREVEPPRFSDIDPGESRRGAWPTESDQLTRRHQ